jgi:uncharacterized protein (DUF983 family)
MSIYLEIVDRALAEMDAERSLAQRGRHEVTLPSCPRCGSFALYRLLNSTTDCETCGNNFLTVRISWRI